MNLWLTAFELTLLCTGLTWVRSDDEDSSEYGVAEGDVGTNCTCGVANKEAERIVGGEETKKNEYPMMALLVKRNYDYNFCGGTIVTRRHVLTAAHCDLRHRHISKIEEMGVYVGVHKVQGENRYENGQYIPMKEFISHPDYKLKKAVNNIAVVYLDGEIDFNTDKASPACLPLGNENFSEGKLKALGWGDTRFEENEGSKVLMKVDLNVVPHEQCEQYYGTYDKEANICSYTERKGICLGDYGGPLLWRDPDTNRYVLVAVTSFAYNCAIYPSVFSNVIYFLPWIQSIISATDSSQQTCAKVSN